MNSILSFVGNIFWFILGGFFSGLVWWFVSLIMFISIIGIPFGRACFVIGKLAFFPFGKDVIKRNEANHQTDIGTGFLGLFGNIFWFLFGGIWLFLGQVFIGILLCLTLIGIPFGLQHFKLAGISLAPIGKMIVTNEEAAEIKANNAQEKFS